MICQYCGAVNPDEAVFCTHCGTKLSAEQIQEPTPQYQQPQQPSEWLAEAPLISAPDASYYNDSSHRKRIVRRWHIRSIIYKLVIVALIAGLIVTGVLLYRHYVKPGIVGIYIQEKSSANSLTLNSDNTFALVKDGFTVTGTYEVKGNTITLTPTKPSGRATVKSTVEGNTIIDPEGERWTK
jgi:zinc-ribbon domain